MNSGKQIKIGAMISYATLAINIIVTLLYTPWMVATIGKSNYALYTLATSFISLFIMDFGLSAATSRFVAKYKAEGNTKKINEFVSSVELLYMVIAGIILAILTVVFFFLDKIYIGLTDSELKTFRLLYIIVATYSVVSFPCLPFSGILNAYEKFVQTKLCDLFHRLFTVALVIIALILNLGVTAVVVANAVSGIITVLLKFIIIKRKTDVAFTSKHINMSLLRQVAGFSIWITIVSLAQRCIFNLAPTILGIVATSEDIAVFSPASALEGYFYSISAAVNGLFLATVSRYISKNEDDKIYNLMLKVGRYQFIIMCFIFVGFLCVGKDFMIAWMGEEYVAAWPCALLIFIPDVLIFSQQIANTTVIAKNKVKQQAIGYLGMAIVCVALSFVLCSRYGVIGSGISIAISYFFLFCYMNYVYYKHLNINVFRFFKDCYIKLGLPIVIGAAIAFAITSFIPLSQWIGVAVKGLVVCVVYIIVILPALNQEEKNMIKKIFRRKHS